VVKLYMLIRSVKLNSTLKIVLSENSLVLSHLSPFGDNVINVLPPSLIIGPFWKNNGN